jgi:predicted GH43/DUF377 family glycosyl hydrolase
MISFINKTANRILEEEKTRKNQELKLSTIEKTEDLPLSSYKLPEEGTLIATVDLSNLVYINSSELIEPDINLYYYNSCICRYKDGFRLFYRCGKNPKSCEDRIATCLLTSDLQVVPDTNIYINVFSNWQASRDSGPDTLDRHIRYYYSDSDDQVKSFIYKDGTHVEDPRVVEFMGHWFLFYTDGMTVGVAKLDLDTCDVIYSHFLDVPPSNIVGTDSDGREKNWIPIVSYDTLYLLYSDIPRTFIHCIDNGTNLSVKKYDKLNFNVTWKYGNIRGGCPPIEYDENSLIWFFHSSKKVQFSLQTPSDKIYFIGAYLTTKSYPFSITQITQYPIFFGFSSPILANRSYQTNVVFPCGAICEDDTFIISMGINDYQIGHLKCNKSNILWKPFMKQLTHIQLKTIS